MRTPHPIPPGPSPARLQPGPARTCVGAVFPPRPGRRAGFTFMDILSAIMIIAVVSSIAIPTISGFFATQQAASQAALLVNDVRLARATAIENQGYTRILFRADLTGWIVQELVDGSGLPVQTEGSVVFSEDPDIYNETAPDWRSILDGAARELDSETTLALSKAPPASIFFRYDGLIVNSPYYDALPIQVRRATFTYGDAALQVDITPAGAVESVEYFRDDY
ncbi:MAG: hypothetical protein GX442_07535 [Candidatus Riflebacteria bacterium]|nr:hypothetical protein [Candidatus Riflebacteria bacterium]